MGRIMGYFHQYPNPTSMLSSVTFAQCFSSSISYVKEMNIFCVVTCRSVFVFSPSFPFCHIVLSVIRFTTSDYPFGILKHVFAEK